MNDRLPLRIGFGPCMLVLLIGASLLPVPAHAEGWVGIFGGAARPGFDDFEEDFTAQIDELGLTADDALDGCGSFAVETALSLSRGFVVGLSFQRLAADASASSSDINLDYDLPATAINAFVLYRHQVTGRLSIGVGGGLGGLHAAGEMTASNEQGSAVERSLNGEALLIDGFVSIQLSLVGPLQVAATGGYLRAKVEPVSDGAIDLTTIAGDPLVLDYSGPYLRVGIAVAFDRES
jgi:hypothetical protein